MLIQKKHIYKKKKEIRRYVLEEKVGRNVRFVTCVDGA